MIKKKLTLPQIGGYLYTYLMAVYFSVSGFVVLFDVPAKLKRIDLQALNTDGQIAFMLIYTSLMMGIGAAILILQLVSKTWVYGAWLAVVIICAFMVFRVVGSLMVGELSSKQINFLVYEALEVGIGAFLLWKNQ